MILPICIFHLIREISDIHDLRGRDEDFFRLLRAIVGANRQQAQTHSALFRIDLDLWCHRVANHIARPRFIVGDNANNILTRCEMDNLCRTR